MERALELIRQVAEGLAEVHAGGLLHRDVKPANVLVGDDDVPRLVDFGLAAPLADPSLRGVSGTLAYMAPEQARGEVERIDARSDVFGLGAVLYELLTGRPPYQADSPQVLWQLACAGDVEPPREHNPAVPAAVNELCLRCLARDPRERFASAAEVVQAIGRWQRLRRYRLSRRTFRAALVALLVLVLPLGMYFLTLPRAGPRQEREFARQSPEHGAAVMARDRMPGQAATFSGRDDTRAGLPARGAPPNPYAGAVAPAYPPAGVSQSVTPARGTFPLGVGGAGDSNPLAQRSRYALEWRYERSGAVAPDGRPPRLDFPVRVELVKQAGDGAGKWQPVPADKAGVYQLTEGERVGLRVAVDRPAFLSVWYVDGRNQALRLFPARAGQESRLPARQAKVLTGTEAKGGLLLPADAARGPGHLYVLASARPWNAAPAVRGAAGNVSRKREDLKALRVQVRRLKDRPAAREKLAEVIVPVRVKPGR